MSDNLNQQFNDYRFSQLDQFKGINQFMQNQPGNDDFVSNSYDLFNFFNVRIQTMKIQRITIIIWIIIIIYQTLL